MTWRPTIRPCRDGQMMVNPNDTHIGRSPDLHGAENCRGRFASFNRLCLPRERNSAVRGLREVLDRADWHS